jgi:two-component system response regulator DesR
MIKVLIGESVTMVREALAVMLGLEHDIEIVGQVSSADDIVPAALVCRPQVAVLDAGLPGGDPLDEAGRLRALLADCAVLMLAEPNHFDTLRRSIAADVAGYLLKDASAGELADAVRRVANGQHVLDSRAVLTAWDGKPNPLTLRESEVLQLAAEGAGPREIAARLQLSIGTVRNYLTTVVAKLNARNRVDAVRIAQEYGWLS